MPFETFKIFGAKKFTKSLQMLKTNLAKIKNVKKISKKLGEWVCGNIEEIRWPSKLEDRTYCPSGAAGKGGNITRVKKD